MQIQKKQSYVSVTIKGDLYSSDVIFKCFYWYLSQYSICIDYSEKMNLFTLKLIPKSKRIDEIDLAYLKKDIMDDLIDFKLRDIVSKETKTIREIINAKAFASVLQFNSIPPGDLDNPLEE